MYLALNCIHDTVYGLRLDLLVDYMMHKVAAMLIFQSRSKLIEVCFETMFSSGLYQGFVCVCSFYNMFQFGVFITALYFHQQ